MNKFAVIGLGQFGVAIAKALAEKGAEVMAIDNDPNKVDYVKDDVAHAVALDATDIKALRAQNIMEVDAAVVAIGEDFEALLLTTVQLMELEVNRLVARAANEQQRMILEKIGVEEILSPEENVGKSLAASLLNPSIKSFLPLTDGYEIVEINSPRRLGGRNIKDIDLRRRYNINLITIKRYFKEKNENGETVVKEHIIGVPKAETIIKDNDVLILLGKSKDIDRFIQVNG